MQPVLVAYATKYGATREIAEAIAERLRERGCEAHVRPAAEVRSLEGYSAVVLGGALYFFRWQKEARAFIARHRGALAGVPVAIFADGPLNDTEEEFAGARQQLDRALAKEAWLRPVSVRVFGGRLDPDALKFPHSNPAMKNMPPSDIRDWDDVRAWADEVAKQVREPVTV